MDSRHSGSPLNLLVTGNLVVHPGAFERGIHGLPKVLLGPAIPYHSMPCRWPSLKRPFQKWPPAGQAAYGRLTTPLDAPCHTLLCATPWSRKFEADTIPASTWQATESTAAARQASNCSNKIMAGAKSTVGTRWGCWGSWYLFQLRLPLERWWWLWLWIVFGQAEAARSSTNAISLGFCYFPMIYELSSKIP
jgi:hypothetical protein